MKSFDKIESVRVGFDEKGCVVSCSGYKKPKEAGEHENALWDNHSEHFSDDDIGRARKALIDAFDEAVKNRGAKVGEGDPMSPVRG